MLSWFRKRKDNYSHTLERNSKVPELIFEIITKEQHKRFKDVILYSNVDIKIGVDLQFPDEDCTYFNLIVEGHNDDGGYKKVESMHSEDRGLFIDRPRNFRYIFEYDDNIDFINEIRYELLVGY